MTKIFCDICGHEVSKTYTVKISGHPVLELCEKCWKYAWLHFEVLKRRYGGNKQ